MSETAAAAALSILFSPPPDVAHARRQHKKRLSSHSRIRAIVLRPPSVSTSCRALHPWEITVPASTADGDNARGRIQGAVVSTKLSASARL